MSLVSGKYYAAPLGSNELSFELAVDVTEGLSVINGQRSTFSTDVEEPNELEAITNQVKEGIAEIKKGGWKSALSLVKKAASQYISDEKESQAPVEEKDPMDPDQAFALLCNTRVKYELIHLLEDKHKYSEHYQFRSDNSYGVLIPQGNGVFQEISFTYPSHEYAQKHYPEQHVGHSVADWRREDDVLHRMRIHYLSMDKSKAEAAANSADERLEKQNYFSVNRASTRAQEKTRFSAPSFNLDAKSAELSLNFLYGWFLPRKTQTGRQIQYNWDALRIRVTQGDKLIKRAVCWSSSKGAEYIKSQRNPMELMDGGYLGELSPGHYELRVSIYEDEFLVYPFEVIKSVSTDTRMETETYYTLSTALSDYARFTICPDSQQFELFYPLVRLLSKQASVEKFEVSVRVTKDNQAWPDYEFDTFEATNRCQQVTVRNNPSWAHEDLTLQIPFGNQREYEGRMPAENGSYIFHIEVDGKEVDQICFDYVDGKVQNQVLPIDLSIADIDFPEEHHGQLILIKQQA